MIELIAGIILISSLLGIFAVLFNKIPVLINLPISAKTVTEDAIFLKIKNIVKDSIPFKSISLEDLLQKLLSRIRVIILKAENKTSAWLQKLREKSQKNKKVKEDNYWDEIRKTTKE